LARVIALPIHTFAGPAIVAGVVLTETTAVVMQPLPIVYVIVVVPGATPVTTPVPALTVATDVLLLVHETAVAVALLRFVVEPGHMASVPVIADGDAFTVTTFVL
jgi:hypothetical protein